MCRFQWLISWASSSFFSIEHLGKCLCILLRRTEKHPWLLSPLSTEDAAPKSRISKTELSTIFVVLDQLGCAQCSQGPNMSCRSWVPGMCLSLLGLCERQQPLVEQEDGWHGLIWQFSQQSLLNKMQCLATAAFSLSVTSWDSGGVSLPFVI